MSDDTLEAWIARQYAEDPGLRERVAALLAEYEVFQFDRGTR